MRGLRRFLSDQWQRSWTRKKMKNQSGVAIMLAIFTLSLVLYLAMDVQYETQVEYVVNGQAVNRLKAYYAARSGVELSLLRIKIYQQLKSTVGKQLGPNANLLNLIWSFPFAWPPILPGEVNDVDQGLIDQAINESFMDGSYMTTITDEGTKIDINDLDSSSKVLRESTRKLLFQIFQNELEGDTAFARRHRDFRADELIEQITDWIDSDTSSQRGGDESQYYQDTDDERMPPNRQFRTIDELRLIPMMTDEIFDLLAPRITVYGAKAINPNTASADVLKSIDSSITDEIATAVLTRRQDLMNGGPFPSPGDFWDFIMSKGARITPEVRQSTPIVTDSALNFRIRSIGTYGNSTREIEVVVYDIPQTASVVAGFLKKEVTPTGGTTATAPTTGQSNQTATKGPPRIVYWFEK